MKYDSYFGISFSLCPVFVDGRLLDGILCGFFFSFFLSFNALSMQKSPPPKVNYKSQGG